MNLSELFETQKQLDAKIVKEKGLEGQDLLDKKILALQVELGELANEWRGFKFWSEDQESRTYEANPMDECEKCKGQPLFYDDNNERITGWCENCDGVGVHFHNPLLEEYVDCLHFILSIGNEIGIEDVEVSCDYTEDCSVETFNKLFYTFSELWAYESSNYIETHYKILFQMFIGLGERHLGFTWEQIEQAYYDKNKINYERQENGY